MSNNEERYYQPTDSKDAMREIQKLFNLYCNEPLNNKLVQYHLKLQNQVKTNILPAAEQEKIPSRVTAARSIITTMEEWLKLRLAGKPYNGKMKHFHFVSNDEKLRYKRHSIKVKGNHNLRSSRH